MAALQSESHGSQKGERTHKPHSELFLLYLIEIKIEHYVSALYPRLKQFCYKLSVTENAFPFFPKSPARFS